MKKLMAVALALVFVLSMVPAMAETNSPSGFQALSKLPTAVPMTDKQLASIEGEGLLLDNIQIQCLVNIVAVCAGNSQNVGNIYKKEMSKY
jgi:hypothetical protein